MDIYQFLGSGKWFDYLVRFRRNKIRRLGIRKLEEEEYRWV